MKKVSENIKSDDGKILLFSIDDFVATICNKDTCFVCGIERSEASFNDEHIIPRWVLKRYELFGKVITLPNDKKFKYGKYKIPCCQSCNSLLGENIEKRVAEGFDGGFSKTLNFFDNNKELIFSWICLLYIKTHLKDKMFQYDFKSDKKIGDDYDWEDLHHIHCMARSIYTGVDIEKSVYGSMFIYPCAEFDDGERFDYIDLYGTGTVLIRLGDFFIICVMNDSKLVSQLIKSRTERITGKLNFLQVRELYSRVSYENLRIIDRPKYYTAVRRKDNHVRIQALINKKIHIESHNEALLGDIMYKLVKDYIYRPKDPELKVKMEEQVQGVKNGQWTYLFDSEGKFLNDSALVIDDEKAVLADLKNGIDIFTR
ncbi:hypothetical protein [Pseudoalteromonas porphyrae]|uniref:hypothetical protein n=1 Tax=Pseudoalteromonas porphyrae TaxID=187330 RepID=UPI0006C84CF9|nr:hypothetical protein [Pseudoalteromonas porphyrae]